MILTTDNYFSLEANQYYFSNSQFKGFLDCPAKEMAKINGEWIVQSTPAMMIGKYVHAWNEGVLDKFKEDNKNIVFLKNGGLRSDFEKADAIIEVIKKDPKLMLAINGLKEVIFTASMFGAPWKIVVDSYFPEKKRFGDLKIVQSLYAKFWNQELNQYLNIFQNFGYLRQMALYAEVIRLSNNHELNYYFEPFLAVITKEDYPDKAIISFVSSEESLEEFILRELSMVAQHMPEFIAIKSGEKKARRCELCDYCRKTKILSGTKHYTFYNIY